MSTRPITQWGRCFLLVAALAVSPRCYDFRTDELLCEEATAHVDGCCEQFLEGSVSCEYKHIRDMCGADYEEFPDLSESRAEKLLSMSCDELRDENVCDRAAAGALGSWTATLSAAAEY